MNQRRIVVTKIMLIKKIEIRVNAKMKFLLLKLIRVSYLDHAYK